MKKSRDMKIKITKQATRLLLAALKHIPFDGWSNEVIDRAAKDCGISKAGTEKLLPNGVIDLVRYFSAWADDEMLAVVSGKRLIDMRVRERITFCVRTRLEILMPYRESLSSLMRYLAIPPRNIVLPGLVWKTADAMWVASGDTATDYNRYTKRMLLSGLLTATTLYWLNDDSKSCSATWTFLDRRVDNVMSLGKVIGKIKGRVS